MSLCKLRGAATEARLKGYHLPISLATALNLSTSPKRRRTRLNAAAREPTIPLATPPGRPRFPPAEPAPRGRPPGSPLDVALVRQVVVEHLEAGGGSEVSETHGVGCIPEARSGGGKERQEPAAGADGEKGPGRPEKSLYRDGGVSLRCTGKRLKVKVRY